MANNVTDISAVSPAQRLAVRLNARIRNEGITRINMGELSGLYHKMMTEFHKAHPELRSNPAYATRRF